MHPATLHGVGVITKLYFAIFAAFKESMALNLAQRSFKVIDFGTNRKRVYIFLLIIKRRFVRRRNMSVDITRAPIYGRNAPLSLLFRL